MKKLLAILGGPHEHGSTAAMMDCAVKAALSKGWDVTTVILYNKKITYCKGCMSCGIAGHCVIKDDIQEIEALLKACDRVILAAPVYWANVPAAVKNMFDRLFGTMMEETKTFPHPRLSHGQEYLLFTACNTPAPFSYLFGQSRGAIHAMDEVFKTSGMKRLGNVTFAGAHGSNKLPDRTRRKIESFWK